jgi:hypothetical protein
LFGHKKSGGAWRRGIGHRISYHSPVHVRYDSLATVQGDGPVYRNAPDIVSVLLLASFCPNAVSSLLALLAEHLHLSLRVRCKELHHRVGLSSGRDLLSEIKQRHGILARDFNHFQIKVPKAIG